VILEKLNSISCGVNSKKLDVVMSKKSLGLIVNPIAGMGGRVGLKGSDGNEIIRKAKELGAVPVSHARTIEALRQIESIKDSINLTTYPYDMGEDEARECGFSPHVIGSIVKGYTTSEDTKRAARDMLDLGVDLLLFAGGDGTARDICEAINSKVPVLGIPTGVKMQSAVYAINPRSAGDLALMYILEEPVEIREAEVMDIDEQAFRENRISSKLYGYLKVIYEKNMVQNSKTGGVAGEESSLDAVAWDIVDNMENDCVYIVGPGTTLRAVMERLGLQKTLLGVDVVQNRMLLASDVNEKQLNELVNTGKTKIVVTIIGGQGFLFGRGNQQISPGIIRKVGRDNIIVVATPEKLASLRGAPLLVDSGDEEVDRMLSGYIRIVTGYGRKSVYPVRQH
jgi:predicted polyphosphate/ATP-dependent NAD kinase